MRTHSMREEKKIPSRDDSTVQNEIFIGKRGSDVPLRAFPLWYSRELPQCAAQIVTMCCSIRSGPHSGAAGAAGEVPGRSEETQPARGGTRAAHGHLPALPRYCLCSSACSLVGVCSQLSRVLRL